METKSFTTITLLTSALLASDPSLAEAPSVSTGSEIVLELNEQRITEICNDANYRGQLQSRGISCQPPLPSFPVHPLQRVPESPREGHLNLIDAKNNTYVILGIGSLVILVAGIVVYTISRRRKPEGNKDDVIPPSSPIAEGSGTEAESVGGGDDLVYQEPESGKRDVHPPNPFGESWRDIERTGEVVQLETELNKLAAANLSGEIISGQIAIFEKERITPHVAVYLSTRLAISRDFSSFRERYGEDYKRLQEILAAKSKNTEATDRI